MKTIAAAALGCAVALGASNPGMAMPIGPVAAGDSPVIQVFGGCGPYGHRGPWGGCRPGGQWGGYRFGRACPPGWHLGPMGARCWPNRYY